MYSTSSDISPPDGLVWSVESYIGLTAGQTGESTWEIYGAETNTTPRLLFASGFSQYTEYRRVSVVRTR
jgi:hypothetical protein